MELSSRPFSHPQLRVSPPLSVDLNRLAGNTDPAMPIADTLHIARWTLRASLRCRFFWVWNIAIWLVVLSLQVFYFFDFDGDGQVVGEFFISTVGLAALVNSIGFQILFTMKQRRGGVWSTLLAASTRPGSILAGLVLALVLLQQCIAMVCAVSFAVAIEYANAPLASGVWLAHSILCLEIVSLCAAHVAVAVVFSETWALLFMLGIYVVGHLSETLYRSTAPGGQVVVDLLYCLIPDLESAGYLGGRDTPIPGSLIANVAIGSLVYTALAVLVASWFLRRAASTRNA